MKIKTEIKNAETVITFNPDGKCLCELTTEELKSACDSAIKNVCLDLANVNQLHNPFWCLIPGNENERYEPLRIPVGTCDMYGNDHSRGYGP